MTRGLLASLLILWDMLDGSLAGQRVGSNPPVGNQNLQKKKKKGDLLLRYR